MWQPCFIKMQRINFTIEHALDSFNVVDHAIVSGLRDGQDAWFFVFCFACKRIGLDLLHDVFHLEFFDRYWSNDAQMIARWHQKYRNRTAHNDGVQY